MFSKGYISHIISYNSSETLRFEYIIMFLNSYAPQIWIQSYFYHNIRKYDVTRLIVMQKYIFIVSIWMEENKSYVKDPRTEINIQTGSFKWKIMILENFRKKNNHIWSSYEKDIPIINFSSESKSEIWNKHVFFTIFLAAQQCSQGNTYFS